jgi:hypothetical protein
MPPLPEPSGLVHKGYKRTHIVPLEEVQHEEYVYSATKLHAYAATLIARVAELQADSRRMKAALIEARRAIGDHHAPDERGETRVLPDSAGLPMLMLSMVAHHGMNVDGLLINLMRHCKKAGIDMGSSMFLSRFSKDAP